MAKTYVTVKCTCGRVKSVPVGKKQTVKCECGARLWMADDGDNRTHPVADVMNDYPHQDKVPAVTGFFWRKPRKKNRGR